MTGRTVAQSVTLLSGLLWHPKVHYCVPCYSSQFNPFHLISSPSHLLPHIRRGVFLPDIFVLPIRATYFPHRSQKYILVSLHSRIREVQGSNLGTHTVNVYRLSSVPPGRDITSSSRPPPPSTSLRNQHKSHPNTRHYTFTRSVRPAAKPMLLPECRIPG